MSQNRHLNLRGYAMRSLIQPLFLLIASGSLGLVQGQPAQAHAIESTLTYLNGNLELSSQFSTGTPVEGAVVRVLDANGKPGKELGRMDQQGTISLTLPSMQDGTLDLQIDGGPGHRDYLLLPIRSGKVQLDEVVMKPYTAKTQWTYAIAGSPFLLGLAGFMFSVDRQRLKS
tara:strand:- start:388 stop:903 length:516 start_codon:yes stop_codon:yes gene_type:complete